MVAILGSQIRNRRKQLGWNLAVLEVKSKVNSTYLCRIERGKVNPGPDILEKIFNALGVEMMVLLIDKKKPVSREKIDQMIAIISDGK